MRRVKESRPKNETTHSTRIPSSAITKSSKPETVIILIIIGLMLGLSAYLYLTTAKFSSSPVASAHPHTSQQSVTFQLLKPNDRHTFTTINNSPSCPLGRGTIPNYPFADWDKIDHINGTPSKEYFYTHYLRPCKPVIIHNAMTQWGALQKWKSDDYLRALIGHIKVKVERSNSNSFGHLAFNESDWGFWEMSFSDFLSQYLADEKNHWYLDSELLLELRKDIGQWPPGFIPCLQSASKNNLYWVYQNLWFGGGLENSLLHNDLEDNLLHMVQGYKKVTLIPRSTPVEELYEIYDTNLTETKLSPVNIEKVFNLTESEHYLNTQYPRFKALLTRGEVIQVVLQPGDILYIPAMYWHQVTSYCRQIACNIWFDYFDIKNMGQEFIWHHPTSQISAKLKDHTSKCLYAPN